MKVTERHEEMVTLVLIGLVVWAVAIWIVFAWAAPSCLGAPSGCL